MRALLLGVLITGCYSPAARDCTVTCTAAKDCIGDQVCGADHYCAAPSVAGHCSTADAAVAIDAKHDAMRDAPADVTLTVMIGGMGRVDVQGVGSCTQMCMYQVSSGQPLTLTAISTSGNGFKMWQQACASAGSQLTCALTPTTMVRVGAKFE